MSSISCLFNNAASIHEHIFLFLGFAMFHKSDQIKEDEIR
jgi:hypothetical protein